MLLALLHIGWALGMVFPSPSQKLAPTYVIGWRAGARMPSRGATLVIAIALFAMAYASLHGSRWSALLVASVLLGRGSFGWIEWRVRPSIAKTPYKILSAAFYSPLCLMLGALIFASAW